MYLDLRRHGRSEWGDPGGWSFEVCADDVRSFCDALGIVRPVVFGHSMGVPVVLLYATHHPGHASGLVISGGFARLEILPGAGHFPWKDVPEAYRRLLEQFLQSVADS